MEINMTTKQVEQKELGEIDAILPILLKEGLITDIDCRIITSCKKLMEKKAAVYTIIMSKTEEGAANLTEIFRKMTVTIHDKENSFGLPNNTNNDDQNYILPSQNPLMNNIIIKHLFGFLPLEDMKRFRLVCRVWNSTAEICLRKRATINFRPSVLPPQTFMDIAKYSQPDLPFSSFTFSNYKKLGWNISDIQDFLEKWEKNIKEVSFNCIKLVRKCNVTNNKVLIRNYNITPLFINPSNITSLKINHRREEYQHEPKKSLDISLEAFVSIKTLFLNYCRIIVPPKDQITRVAPHNVELIRVSFIRKGKVVRHFHYNDLLDFNKVVNVHLEQDYIHDGILVMGQQVFNVNRLSLVSVDVINWSEAKGSVEMLRLCNTAFDEKNQLKIKLMSFSEHIIEPTVLPETLEVLQFVGNVELDFNEPLHLPNLKYLCIDFKDSAELVYFSNCTNLVELEIGNDAPITQPYKFSLGCIPKSVRKIKMELLLITFNDDRILELDTLILECNNVRLGVTDCIAITSQIKAKVLVVVLGEEWDIDTVGFEKLVAAKEQIQKIIIGSNSSLTQTDEIPFEGSDLSQYVDRESKNEDLYQEFDEYNMNDYFMPYYEGHNS